MNLSEKLQALTQALRQFSATPAPAAPLAFSDYKLEDGTMVRVDGELAVGTLVYVVTEEGLLPAPDGVHSIPEVGVVTTEGGKIVEIGEVFLLQYRWCVGFSNSRCCRRCFCYSTSWCVGFSNSRCCRRCFSYCLS